MPTPPCEMNAEAMIWIQNGKMTQVLVSLQEACAHKVTSPSLKFIAKKAKSSKKWLLLIMATPRIAAPKVSPHAQGHTHRMSQRWLPNAASQRKIVLCAVTFMGKSDGLHVNAIPVPQKDGVVIQFPTLRITPNFRIHGINTARN